MSHKDAKIAAMQEKNAKRAERGERPKFVAVCARCGGEAIVPFEPREDRDVYCSECFAAIRDEGSAE